MSSVIVRYRKVLSQLWGVIPGFIFIYLLTAISNVVCDRKVPWAAVPITGGDSQFYFIYLLTAVSNVICDHKVQWADVPIMGGDSQFYFILFFSLLTTVSNVVCDRRAPWAYFIYFFDDCFKCRLCW